MSSLNNVSHVKQYLLLLGVLLLTACSMPVKNSAEDKMILADHLLAGKIWDVKAGQFVSKDQLARQVTSSRYLLLGETHDNMQHHQGQAWAIAQLAAAKRSAIVAFEMISDQQGKVISGNQYNSTASLIAGLNHIKTNWEYERLYSDILGAALQAGYPVLPANFDREQIMIYGRKGKEELPANIKSMLNENPLPAEQEAASRKEIEGSHCGMINEEMTVAMMLVQRAKDARMAQALMGEDTSEVKVLVAGSGHVRNDRGVPFYLPSRGNENNVLSIAWAEVRPDLVEAGDYAEQWGAKTLPFDYVWFTPRVDRPDPCEQFRQHMKNKK